jgi:hypothetical protein
MKTQMSQTTKRIAALMLLLACLGTLALAQIMPDLSAIYQNGVQVGEIYVPQWGSRSLYVEHWILYPNYVYPNARNGVETRIAPNPNVSYASETDFFARAPFGPGYRYVRVTSADMDKMPGHN